MNYKKTYILREPLGNNALAYEERRSLKCEDPYLVIPSLIDGTLDDIMIGDEIVFEEVENGVLKSCKGLKHFIRLGAPPSYQPTNPLTTIFDNHNHALFFWLEAIREGILEPGFELIHIDEHSDLWDNPNKLDRERALYEESYAWEYTNLSCNVGNYIRPALDVGIVGNIIRIENDYQVDEHRDHLPIGNSVINLDLDFFAPEMDFIDKEKKIQIIRNLIPKVKCVTIATSPYFIDQGRALQNLQHIIN